MKRLIGAAAAAAALMLLPTASWADCGIEEGSIRILSNDFPALRTVTQVAQECDGGGVTVTVNHTAEHENLQVAALSPDPAEYTAKILANGSLVPLVNKGLVRPLNSYVEMYG